MYPINSSLALWKSALLYRFLDVLRQAVSWAFLGTTHRHSASSGIFFLLIAYLLTSSFSRVANNFVWIARMCSATGNGRSIEVSLLCLLLLTTCECCGKTDTPVGLVASTCTSEVISIWILLPCPLWGGSERSERFRRQTGYVRSHTPCSWGRHKSLQLHKMLGLKLCIIVFSIISISCVFKFCFPGQCNLLQ